MQKSSSDITPAKVALYVGSLGSGVLAGTAWVNYRRDIENTLSTVQTSTGFGNGDDSCDDGGCGGGGCGG